MADTVDALGGKRKYKENPLTAKAESGTLRVKIMRKGDVRGTSANGNGGGLRRDLPFPSATTSVRSPTHAPVAAVAIPPPVVPSPPKPRPNRKHVPIFYQRPNAFDLSMTSSTDESVAAQSTSVTSDSGYEQSLSTASTTSASGHFSRLQLDTPETTLPPPPPGNPLFTRGNSESSGSISDLLKHAFPTINPAFDYGTTTSSSVPHTTTATDPLTLGMDDHHPAAALHQLAASSSTYGVMLSRASDRHQPSATTTTAPATTSSGYRFDPMSALQNAVKMASATASASPPRTTPHSSHRYRHDSVGDDHDLGPPPSAPPGFGVQHSLMGGGIESQPVISNVNTRNFDWNKHQAENAAGGGRPRSGSLPNVFEEPDESSDNNHNHAAAVPMWKEV